MVLNLVSFFTQLGIALINLALVYHLRMVFGMSADQIGIAASIYTVTYLFSCIGGEAWARKLSPRHCIEVSLTGMALSIILLVLSPSLVVVYAALALYGCFMSLMWPQVEGWISRGKEGPQLNKAMSAFNFSWSFGAGLAPYIGGVLVEISTVTALSFGSVFLLLVMFFLVLSSRFIPTIKAVPSEKHSVEDAGGSDASTPLRYLCWIGVVLVYTGLSVVQTIFPLYAQDVLKISESTTGVLLLARGVTTCFVFFLLGRTTWWHFRKGIILGVQAAFAVLCLLAVRFTALWMYVPFFIAFGIVFAAAYNMSIFHGASGSINRARRMMIHEVLLTVGTIIGATSGGFVYEHLGFGTVMYVLAMTGIITVAVETVTVAVLRKRFA